MDPVVALVFGLVYLGMLLGEIPGLTLERSGVALLGAIALLAAGRLTPEEAWGAVDVPTIGLLFGLMVVSAQFRLGGFYSKVTRLMAAANVGPAGLLAALIAVAGGLSALLANDVVCLAMASVLIEACGRRGLNPLPFLLALACASNAGSAATLIGNPQNMLIGQRLNLSFREYLWDGVCRRLRVWGWCGRSYSGNSGSVGTCRLPRPKPPESKPPGSKPPGSRPQRRHSTAGRQPRVSRCWRCSWDFFFGATCRAKWRHCRRPGCC
jgi:hypothetical protein